MKVERILHILCLLMEQPRSVEMIIDALAQDHRFDWQRYSKETIYRDIKQLRSSGFKINHSRKTGMYELKSVPVRLDFEPGEIVALAIACHAIPEEAGMPYAKELSGALNKISGLLSPESRQTLSSNPYFEMKFKPVADYSLHQETIEKIRRAIAASREIEMVYYSAKSNKEQKRIVDPYELYFSEGGVRLEGFCHLKRKLLEFRVDRIRELKVLPTTIKVPADDDSFTFKLWLDQKLTRSIGDRFPDQKIKINEDGTSILTARSDNPFHLILQVLAYGERAKLLAPAHLRRRMAAIADQMYILYAGE
ncbi:MAG: WYL domain-containing protein [Firmicutes bacterium]|nr:WYL domain-containing protein [Bacillota bacterium]